MTFAEWRFWLSVNSLKTRPILFSVLSILLLNPFIEGFFFKFRLLYFSVLKFPFGSSLSFLC